MSPDLAAMVVPFADEELKSFQGAGGKQLTYIEDETVMDRLDIGFGMGNWQVHVEAIPYVEGVVKVSLSVRIDPESEWIRHEDFGYPNNAGPSHQLLKEAVSDGIRRCGRYLGIARDLYRKDAGPQPRPTPIRPATPVALPRPSSNETAPSVAPRSSTALPEEPDLGWDVLSEKKPPAFADAQAAKVEADGSWTYPQLADKAKALSVPIKVLGDTAKRLYGPNAWKLTELTGVQRYAVAVEVGLL